MGFLPNRFGQFRRIAPERIRPSTFQKLARNHCVHLGGPGRFHVYELCGKLRRRVVRYRNHGQCHSSLVMSICAYLPQGLLFPVRRRDRRPLQLARRSLSRRIWRSAWCRLRLACSFCLMT